jgi:hypothetical protein
MELQNALSIAQTYPFVDIDADGRTIRKHINPQELSIPVMRGYVQAHKQITIVPKKLNGNSPVRLIGNSITVDHSEIPQYPIRQHFAESLNGFDGAMQPNNGNSELYRIMYENAKEEAREYKRKYEDAINDKHKAELELAGSKNSVVGDIAQGLAGFAPMIMGGMTNGVAGMGNATPPPAPALKPVADVKLAAIVKYYSTLDESSRQKVYDLLAKVFADISKIDKLLSTI